MPESNMADCSANVNGVVVEKRKNYNVLLITYNGQTKTLIEWAMETGVHRQTLYTRIMVKKWPLSEALTTKTVRQERHGCRDEPLYGVWCSMKQRCTDKNHKRYKDYGGRGIKVCDHWLLSFKAFKDDMGPKPTSGHTVDRIDNDGNYEPGNCRWATRTEQSRNQRSNINLTYQGRTMVLDAWAVELGLARSTLRNRIFTLGWSVERSFTTPAGPNGRKTE